MMGVVVLIVLAMVTVVVLGEISAMVDETFNNREKRRNAEAGD